MSFSWEQRKEVSKRANGVDEVTGLPIPKGEIAHVDHTKNENYFDIDSNALFVSAMTHLWLHMIDEDNGMTKRGNKWAVKEIKKRINPTPEETEIFGSWMRKH